MIGPGATMQGGQQPVYEPPARSPYLASLLQQQQQGPISSPGQLGTQLLAQALMQHAPKPQQAQPLLGGLFGLGQGQGLSNGFNWANKAYGLGMK